MVHRQCAGRALRGGIHWLWVGALEILPPGSPRALVNPVDQSRRLHEDSGEFEASGQVQCSLHAVIGLLHQERRQMADPFEDVPLMDRE